MTHFPDARGPRCRVTGVLLGLMVVAAGHAWAEKTDSGKKAAKPLAPAVTETEALKEALENNRAVWAKLPVKKLKDEDRDALDKWVRQGGVLITNTDLAGLFGFPVQAPRSTSDLWGMARRATGWLSTPLLEKVAKLRYALDRASVRVGMGPGIVPLLADVDRSAAAGRPVLVSAFRPYGRGYVLFQPPYVHSGQLSGRDYLRNVERFIQSASLGVEVPVESLLALAEALGEKSKEADRKRPSVKTLAQVWKTVSGWRKLVSGEEQAAADEDEDDDSESPNAEDGDSTEKSKRKQAPPVTFRLTERELSAVADALLGTESPAEKGKRIPPSPETVKAVRAAFTTWAGMAYYRAGDADSAAKLWRTAAQQDSSSPLPHQAMGALEASLAEDIHQPAGDRIAHAGRAINELQRSLLPASTAIPLIGSEQTIAQEIAKLRSEAAVWETDPPAVTLRYGLVIRHFSPHTFLQYALNQLRTAANAAQRYGLQAADAEVLVYRVSGEFGQWLQQYGRPSTGILPTAAAQGTRLVTYTYRKMRSNPQLTHEYAIMAVDAMIEGARSRPGWMAEGLAMSCSAANRPNNAALSNAYAQGALLTIDQLNSGADELAQRLALARDVQSQVFREQCYSMVQTFIASFGLEKLHMVLREIAWGATADQALSKQVNLTQDQFLRLWAQKALGVR